VRFSWKTSGIRAPERTRSGLIFPAIVIRTPVTGREAYVYRVSPTVDIYGEPLYTHAEKEARMLLARR